QLTAHSLQPELMRPSDSGGELSAGSCQLRQRPRDLLDLERLDDVADLDVLVPVETDAALETLLDLGDVVLEPPERSDLALVDHAVVAQETQLGGARDRALGDVAPGDDAELGNLEGVAHFGAAPGHFLERRVEQALHRLLDLVRHVVDDGVEADVDADLLGLL